MITNMVSHVLGFLAYEYSYAWYTEDTTNNTGGLTLMGKVGYEEYVMVEKETAAMMAFMFASKDWFKGQVSMLPEEDQEKYWEMHGGKKGKKHGGHDDDDMEFSLLAFYGF